MKKTIRHEIVNNRDRIIVGRGKPEDDDIMDKITYAINRIERELNLKETDFGKKENEPPSHIDPPGRSDG